MVDKADSETDVETDGATDGDRCGSDNLGGRLRLLAEADLDEAQRAVRDRLLARQVPEAARGGFTARTRDGRFIGPFNAYLHFPGPGAGLLDWAAAQVHQGSLSPVEREVVTLAVGALWRAPYEVQAHAAAAQAAGVPGEAVAAVLARTDSDLLPHRAQVVRQLADALLVDHRVGEDLYRSAAEVLGQDGIAAVAHLVGQYVTISALLIAFDVPAVEAGSNPTTDPHDRPHDRPPRLT